jgi:isoquinoline 1-oxidoreductase alpha subunit
VNGRPVELAEERGDMPLLWFIREDLQLQGTKFGCGIGQCGACMIHLDGSAAPSCVLTCAQANGRQIATIEGLADGETLHPVQAAWLEEDVAQCGYCQCGQIMAAVALLRQTPEPTDAQIEAAMTNLCRCGTYPRIRAAIKRAARQLRSATTA